MVSLDRTGVVVSFVHVESLSMVRTVHQERQYCVVERMPCRVSSSGTWAVVSLEYDGDDEGCGQLESLVECR